MAALAAPVRIEGFGAPSIAEAAPVLRRNPASLPNVLEAANALEAVGDSDSRRQLTEMMGRLTARRAALRDGPWQPLPPQESGAAAAGTPPVPIFRRSESSSSESSQPSERSANGIGQRDQSQGSLGGGGSAQGLDRAPPVRATATAPAPAPAPAPAQVPRSGAAVATGWSTGDRTGSAPPAVATVATVAVPPGDSPAVRGYKGGGKGPSPLSQEAKGGIKCVQSSPNLSSFSSIEEVAMRREIVCDNCERQCPSPVDTKIGIFCSGECQWSAHFNRRDLRKW